MRRAFYCLAGLGLLLLSGCAGQTPKSAPQQAAAAPAAGTAAAGSAKSSGASLLKAAKPPVFIICAVPDAGNFISNMMINVIEATARPGGTAAERQAQALEAKYGPGHVLMDTSRDCARGRPGQHPEKLMTYQQWAGK